ncbi:hypothetical protein MPTK1_2g21940 [Marchantia polymorpha subsp. ruderalis]|uniref:Uncharacterized protein n=1 Tax=Marchantia polymorpha TaxID=3197 RepID=A0A2R6X2N8_MARPO|nr:hypothetical protein MARPO_0040s0021 [Marchantia polymorpha]BBN03241.1 hypothetical protein Mp_2g21940 [Marchantia polymorpha subsp. ruderalis]|eukprot:PTQ40336.1 hypothetical protein MARPO_0040s0021 [Marchantia polymorpha]
MTLVSDIKLIRTDTTLDLSQKAEKESLTFSVGSRSSHTYAVMNDYEYTEKL